MALTAVSQLGVGLVLPALPLIARNLGIATENVTLVISTYLIGLAVGQLVIGPLSDRFGRRRLLILGLLLLSLAGGAAFAEDPLTLLSARLLQGAVASAPLALGLAVTRDLYEGTALLRVTALITMAAVVPGLAPALGGMVTESLGWRAAFGFTAAASGGLLFIIAARLPETNASPRASLGLNDMRKAYGELVRDGAFIRNALPNALMFSALYAFLVGAPLMLIGPAGLTPLRFGFVLIATSACYLLGGWVMLNAPNHPTRRSRALASAWAAAMTGPLLLVTLASLSALDALTTAVGAGFFSLGLGALLPGGIAGALTPFGKKAGTASALLGAMNMAAGALAGAVVGWASEFTPAYPAVMATCVVGAFLVSPRARHGHAS